MKRLKCLTLGCKVNTYETQAMREMLEKEGYFETQEGPYDCILINTCAVTSMAESKSRQKIHAARKQYPKAIIVAIGCFVQANQAVVKEMPEVDLFLGTEGRQKLPELLRQFSLTKQKNGQVDEARKRETYECLSITSYHENTRAFVKIQDGCDNFCSYCLIPYTRGKFRSRNREDILQEIHALADRGFKEIVLTGIDTAGYGKEKQDKYLFIDLVKELLAIEPRIQRLRISSIEISQIGDDFIQLLQQEKRIAPHLHIPLQSGSASVLKRMNRRYDKQQFLETIQRIRKTIPSIAIACDVIVGFPQETEEEFLETVAFIQQCQFAFLHVFPYSIRKGTVASEMNGQVPSAIKKARVQQLLTLSKQLSQQFALQFVNQEVEVLIEGRQKQGRLHGFTEHYLPFTFSSEIDFTVNQIVKTICKIENIEELITFETKK